MIMMGNFGLLALALTITPVQEVTDVDRFKLFNNCEPMRLLVEGLRDDAADIGLTEERLQVAVESRLRGARLYTSDRGSPLGSPLLYVSVSVVGSSFNTSLHYNKQFIDLASGISSTAITWFISSTGVHGQDSAYIVSSLSGPLDKFITEYLRVNESACTGSPQPPTQ